MRTFFYKAYIKRADRRVCREGTLQAKWPMEALDKLAGYAINEWKKPLLRVEIFEINDGGELESVATVEERINTVLNTHKGLDTGQHKEAIKKREERKALPPPSPARTPVPVNSWDWMGKVGKYETAPSFATLKLQEGAFK
jgi:hypothetical protein